jgi:parvulin-like peptidyl-prolyl isomerase
VTSRFASRTGGALLAVWLAAPLAGCGTRVPVVARVSTRSITVDDFNAAARANWMQYPGTPDQAKRLLLDDLVRRDLLLMVADARHLERDSSVRRLRASEEDQVLMAALSQQLAPPTIPVSDAEVATFYAWSGIRARLQLIYCTDRLAADAAAAELKGGRPFEAVANQFTPAGLIPPGGNLGEVAAGSLVDPLDGLVREAPVGVIVGPVEAPGEGWFIARVLDRRVVPPNAPLEMQRPQLSDMLRQRKQRLSSTRAFQELREQYRVALEPGGAQTIFAIFNVPDQTAAESKDKFDVPSAERARVMARYVDASGAPQTYTLGEALDDLRTPDTERPAGTVLPAIEEWLQQQVVRRVAILEARRRGIDRDPAVMRTIDERVNNAMLESVYGAAVANDVTASPEDVRAAFERHAAQYQRLIAVRVQHITFNDSASSNAFVEHGAHHAASLAEAAKMAGISARVIEERVTFPSRDPSWAPLQPNFQTMAPGEWAGPIRTRDGFRVFEVVDKEQTPATFESLSPAVQHALEQEAIALKRDQRLTTVTDSLRRIAIPLEIRQDVLARIPWPPVDLPR